MRILHVINQLSGRAGAEVSLEQILVGLDRQASFELGLAVLSPSKSDVTPLDDTRVSVHVPTQDLRLRSGLSFLRETIKRFQPDLVHTTLTEANTVGRIAALLSGTPAMVSLVNTPYVPEARMNRDLSGVKHRLVRTADRVLSRHATTHFHAITHAAADHAIASFGINPSQVDVVPRGRDRQRLGHASLERRRRTRARLEIGDEVPVLLNVARQEPQKGQVYAIEAMPRIWQSWPAARLLIVGREGHSTPALLDATARVNGVDRVDFLGVRHDIGDLLSAADVFIFPSLYEGLGGAVLEAMAMEVPIVASDAPALVEVLDNGSCARLVPVADTQSLARETNALLTDEGERESLAARALARFEEHYTLDRCVDGMIAMYQEVGSRLGLA